MRLWQPYWMTPCDWYRWAKHKLAVRLGTYKVPERWQQKEKPNALKDIQAHRELLESTTCPPGNILVVIDEDGNVINVRID